jgi:hypothetical protein
VRAWRIFCVALRILAAGVLVASAAGCASPVGPFRAYLEAPSEEVRGCAQWYEALERAVEESGVRDAQYARLPGFPYLRVDRMLAALAPRTARGSAALQAYAERLGELDFQARMQEINNLPRSRIETLSGMAPNVTREFALRRTDECGRLLRELDLAEPQARTAMLQAARVPDDYSFARRAFGLYPLTRLAFASGIRRWEEETVTAFREPPPAALPVVRYAPPPTTALPRSAIAGLLARANFDPLGQPLLSGRELTRLAALHAPGFEIAIAGDYDRFGELRWRPGGEVPEVDASGLVVYVQPAYTRYGEQVLLQIVYTIWFPERPARAGVDLLAGRLDGIVWRVTLAPDGEPLLYDSIHPCGCYHLFFPTPRARARPAPDALEEWAFVPQRLPRVAEGERPLIRLASGTHYIEGVSLVRAVDSLTRYEMRPYDELRSLPRPEGGGASAFGPDGLIAGTERAERFLFWPSGIDSPGAMRQWGRHATAFVGRRHFDDADLIELRFELDLGGEGR